MEKNLPIVQETWVPSLDLEDRLQKEIATHSSGYSSENSLAWRILWTEEPGGLQSMGSQRVRHDLATEHEPQLFIKHFLCIRNFVKTWRS